jgi:hypothetical protein
LPEVSISSVTFSLDGKVLAASYSPPPRWDERRVAIWEEGKLLNENALAVIKGKLTVLSSL